MMTIENYFSKNCLIKLLIIILLTSLINSDDRSYLYKYTKLYNSYKFDTVRQVPTETSLDAKNCLESQFSTNANSTYDDIRKCGLNLVLEETFNSLKSQGLLKDPTNYGRLCLNGYITLKGSYIVCSYPQKKRLIAVLLEIMGLGLGHLYIGKHLFFFAKFLSCLLFCYMIVCVIFFVGAINGSNVSEETSKSSTKIVKIIFPLIYAFYIVDLISLAFGFYLDENQQQLY